jgi:hypothetical protein
MIPGENILMNFRYFRYSNFKISFDFNPFVWSFKYLQQRPTTTDPTLRQFYLRILGLSLLLVIDDGTVVHLEYANEVIEEEAPLEEGDKP